MCFKMYVSVVLCFACFFTFSEGFFLPVFVRKQAPQTPAINSAQWAPSSASLGTNSQTPYNSLKDYNPYQQSPAHMTPLQQMQMTPLQPLNQPQYNNYEAAASMQSMPMAMPYPQMQSSFHSVQLVPCLCPISKDVIEQQTQQMQQMQQHSPPAPSSVESGNNAVTVQGSHKVNS